MKKKIRKNFKRIAKGRIVKNENGFTLLEVIITLIVASILGSIAYQFMGTSVVKSALPVNRVKDQFMLNGMIEEMTADYRNFVVKSDNISQELGDTDLIDFKKAVAITKEYGDYIDFCDYIQPDSDQGNRVLKVSIKKGDQTVTALFTRW